ncbi:uncharacterized protein TA12035 [Theileria annulata]|uniref:Uncharacterized protein n=1 Tax=Theileria annulata TaxID=5874 RepID=Q4UD96_THEAN|nr:uncharacterized protein TA12035 [Theileria annulata]CAI74943.1 hypothetical protein TA12035 [Theileria annulata]|eukprot:XP_952675.1 hypothetical protein TA12035 [Theileria annulata]
MFLHKFVLYNLLILCARSVKIANKLNLYNNLNTFTNNRKKIKNGFFFISNSYKNCANGFYSKIDNNLITHGNVLEDSTEIPYNNRSTNIVFYSINDSKVLNYESNTSNIVDDVEKSIFTCAFDGHESLSNVLETLAKPLENVCTRIHNDHKQRFHSGIDNNFEFSAFRSIRALIYLVGSRLLNIAKLARKHNHLQCEINELEAENEKCEKIIRSFVINNVERWEKLLNNTKDFGVDLVKYPQFNSFEDRLEYIKGIWNYFNSKIFNNLLPNYDLKISFYELQSRIKNEMAGTRELFIIKRTNLLEFPEILYLNELKNLPSALGNCVLRSMVKLFLEIYSPFDLVDTVTTILNGFRFVESATGQSDLNFTVIQSPLDKLVEYNQDIMAQINSGDLILEEELDFNDPKSIFPKINVTPFLPNSFLPITSNNQMSVENDTDNSVSEGAVKEVYQLFDKSFEKSQGIDDIWFRGDDLVVPVREIIRALLVGGFDQFTSLFTPVMSKLMQLKPVELNFVQNRIITICVHFLNSLLSLQNYSHNYSLNGNFSINNSVERANLVVVQCILFFMGLHQKCTSNLNLYPLTNDFIRTSPIIQLLNTVNNLGTDNNPNTVNNDTIGNVNKNSSTHKLGLVYQKYLEQKEEFVTFINEYLDDSVPSDDVDALKFLVNYYNFNLFSGRLPINIPARFVDSDYLSSNDSCGMLRTPTIYINCLVKGDKIIIARVILDEMLRIFMKYCSKLTFNEGSNSLVDLLEFNLENRMKQHFLISTNDSFPFKLLDILPSDNLTNYNQVSVENDTDNSVSEGVVEKFSSERLVQKGYNTCKSRLNDVFKSSVGTDDLVSQLHKSLVYEDSDKIWLEKRLPISRFLSSLITGNFHLIHSVISNPASTRVTSKLKLAQLNLLENKFKHHAIANYNLVRELSRDKSVNSLIWENLMVVELAFSDLREELIKNILIYTKDLIEAITNILNTITNTTQIHTFSDDNIKIHDNTVITSDTIDDSPENSVDNVISSNYSVEGKPVENADNIRVSKEVKNDLFDLINEERLSGDDLHGVIQLLYDRYNKYLFGGVLPEVEIKFIPLDELSDLSMDLNNFSAPKILINHLLKDVNLINTQLVTQMCHLSYYYYRHNILEDLSDLGLQYNSIYNLIQSNNDKIIKSKLIPFNIEKKLAKTRKKKNFNQKYIDLITSTISEHTNSFGKNSNYVKWLVEDFVVEVILSRQELKHDERYTNFYEDYHTLKSFATHYYNSKLGLEITDSLEPADTQNKQDAQSQKDILQFSEENDNVTDISDGLVNEESPLEILDTLKSNWLKNMMAKFEKKLGEKGINLFLPFEGFDWNSLLTDEQQEMVINYIAKYPNQSLFSILTKSNALTQQQVINIFTNNTPDPPHDSTHNSIDNCTDDSIPIGLNCADIVNSEESNMFPEVQKTSIDVENLISNIVMDIVYQLPEHEHETFLNFFNKLLDQDFVYCRNILNSHETPSLLLKKSFEALESIHHHQFVDENVHNNILNFLHM